MNPQEREIISGIFDRLKPAAGQPRDAEAEQLIADLIRQQPYAPYVLAQSVYVQEQALGNLNQQVEQLQAQVRQLQQQAQQAPQQSGGFLSGLFGGGAARPMQQQAPQPGPQGGPWSGQQQMQPQQGMMPMQAQQGGPWGGQQQMQPQQRQGSGFLGTALTTVAGVAGGMVVGNMLMNAFSGSSAGHGGQSAAASAGIEPMGSGTTALPASNTSSHEASDHSHNVDYDDGGDFGGGGDSYDA